MPKLPTSFEPLPRSGVSFIEVLISVMITGIIASIAMPVYANSLLRYRAEVSAQRIAQDIAQTSRCARQTNSSRTITFTQNVHSYTISSLSSLDRASATYSVNLTQAPYHSAFASLATAAQPATPLSTLSIVFDRFGMPDQGVSVSIKAGTAQKRVDVAPTTGKVSVQ